MQTRIGWVIYGGDHQKLGEQIQSHYHVCECSEDYNEIKGMIKAFQTSEAFGVVVPQQALLSREEQRAIEILNKTMKLINNRFEVGLLWKNDNIVLPNNKSMA
jgi:hypothetical protein